ncbi:MAG: iron ABC transporter permease [Planctomycetes bacterium]|nr:iron ABC transporter permease [Planctomycetota bacterium]NOG55942.1 iron ABC transporter permease [Planctomycetota bacterium]
MSADRRTHNRAALWLTAFGLLAVALMAARLLAPHAVAVAETVNTSDLTVGQWWTMLDLRCVSIVCAVVIGASLACSGTYLQTLLRNPLASPYILGVASGAGLGAAIARLITRNELGGTAGALWYVDGTGAAIGAVLVLLLVYGLSQRRGLVDPVELLLIGVMVSVMCGAVILLIQHLLSASDTDSLIRWMMGNIDQFTRWSAIIAAAVPVAIGIAYGLRSSRALDAAALSDHEALSVGVPIHTIRLILFGLSGLMTASAVVLAGPIGFVGLVAPHVARLLVGPRHIVLIPASVLIGACLLLAADLGGSVVSPLVVPAFGAVPSGIITSLVGAPIFIWLIRRRSGSSRPFGMNGGGA